MGEVCYVRVVTLCNAAEEHSYNAAQPGCFPEQERHVREQHEQRRLEHWEIAKLGKLHRQGRDHAHQATARKRTEKDDQKHADRAKDGFSVDYRVLQLFNRGIEDQRHRIIHNRLSKYQRKKPVVDMQVMVNGQDGDGISGGDERPKAEAVGKAKPDVGGVDTGQLIRDE